MFKLLLDLIVVIFVRFAWEQCGLCHVFACCTLAFALEKNFSQGCRKVPVGHNSIYLHGRLSVNQDKLSISISLL
jgi:hypothetical protein